MLAIDHVTQTAHAVFRPPPKLTVSEWADTYRRLSPEASAVPGKWSTDTAPYQRGILDAVNDADIHTIVIMSSAQVGKTEILLNVIGYFIDQDPSPILCLQPTLDMAETFSKDRLAPMVRDTPALRGRIADPRSRDSGNTLLHKRFPGGHITLAGANSPASLASRPIRVVLCDEVSRYPLSAAAEGDPVNLAKVRTKTFWNRKIILTSTPTIKGVCRIESAYGTSDQRRFMVPCQHCGHDQYLTWEHVQWPEGNPGEAALVCQSCGTLWSESDRQRAIKRGEWEATGNYTGIAGFHLSELYSPWSTPALMAVAFLEAKEAGTEQLQTWVNTSLGESWEEQGESADQHELARRVEEYPAEVPEPVLILTAGVDIQADRIEFECVGWTDTQESYSIDYVILPGDPTRPEVWLDLADAIRADYAHQSGRVMRIASVAVDTGYLARAVNDFVGKYGARYVYPVKGMPGAGRPIVESISARARRLAKRKSKRIRPELVGVDEGKILLMRRLKIQAPGPGYCHFPVGRDDEYFAQLTAEQLLVRYKKGRPYYEWIKARARNEALDCRVYAHAALLLASPDWEKRKRRTAPAAPKPTEAPNKRIAHRQPMRGRRQ